MTTVQASAKSLVRVHGRGILLSILEKEIILKRIMVLDDERFITETKDWDSYWQPLHELNQRELEDSLNVLHITWSNYLRSKFSPLLRQEYCFRYFSLLNYLISNCKEVNRPFPWIHALKVALGFECFGITTATSDTSVLGAGTCTLRNPCYLLAKLKMPNVPDDPQFLPMITVTSTEKPELFYHYRQYTLSSDSPVSLMLYPTVVKGKRSASFQLLNSFVGGIRYAADPWTNERAQRIFQGIIYPIIQTHKSVEPGIFPMEIVDVGAGSGSLASRICHHIQKTVISDGFHPRLRLWSVDLEAADPARFFRHKKLRGMVDSLYYLGDDYRSWLERPQPLPSKNGLRIALVSRLFNNLSCFSISCLSREDLHPFIDRMEEYSNIKAHHPSVYLAPGGGGVNSLVISNTRVALQEGRTFAQASLADFYWGMYLISRPRESIDIPQQGIFLPVRSFNPECLITSNGNSVISYLVDNCDYIIIEDADLTPKYLIAHAKAFSLSSITIYDMTQALRLKGNYSYVIWPRKKIMAPSFSGEKIW
ncbi:MAG: hypothetical protein JXA17_08220 [Dehalococcoidales bacterium]|nr:hypothetical protein [Dehalococcoidales bacterium]